MNLVYARQLLETNRLSEAEAAYSQLCETEDSAAEALYGLALVNYAKGDYNACVAYLERRLTLDPLEQNSLYLLADIAARHGDHDRAIALLAKILAINPRHAAAHTGLVRLAAVRFNQPAPAVPAAPAVAPRTNGPMAQMTQQPPRPPTSPRSLVGIARGVRRQLVPWRGRPAAHQSLMFRLDCFAMNGKFIQTVGLEIRGFEIAGNLEDGDWIEVITPIKDGRVEVVRNLTTDERVANKKKIFTAH
jgi:tetratricopeptide (TPR) repeat protein